MRVCVFCASSLKCGNEYHKEAESLGYLLARGDYEIVYGGGKNGLMGKFADVAVEHGAKIIGVIPEFLQNLELGHQNITELKKVATMHEREMFFLKESDAIIALPGGCGTIEELLQAITWKQLGLIDSPIIIVNVKNYYNNLIQMLELSIKEKFMDDFHRNIWTVAANSEEAVKLLKTSKPALYDINAFVQSHCC